MPADRPWPAVRAPPGPAGRAHVVPVDGLWLDDTWYYGGSPQTLHQRNLERDPRVVVHLEDTVAAVILEGSMRRLTPTLELAGRLAAASKAKYGYAPTLEMYAGGVWGLRPRRARAWTGFPGDATRFRFA
ncbi:MAG TPA: pyridoxamine 5'-phosphate oxidase family protein [Actinomycetes bacterium]|nr:pyridoxamine 5'-phosphate oxidase family protein [Actinomycetes bacterium]